MRITRWAYRRAEDVRDVRFPEVAATHRAWRTPAVMAPFVAGLAVCVANAGAAQWTVRPVASVKQLMTTLIAPSSDMLFKAVADAPKDEKQWTAVGDQTAVLAESGNLLMIGSRPKDQTTWMEMSRALVDAAALAEEAARKKDANALSEASDQVYETCLACHARYMDKGK